MMKNCAIFLYVALIWFTQVNIDAINIVEIVAVYFVHVYCFGVQGLCNAGTADDHKDRFDSLIRSANSSTNLLRALHSQANEVLYNKFSHHMSTKLQEVVRNDLAQVRKLIADSSNPNTDHCYISSHRKIRQIGKQAFIDMRPCNDAAVTIIKGFVSKLAHSIEVAVNVTENLETIRAICSAAENPDGCLNKSYSYAETATFTLNNKVVADLSDILKIGEEATLEGSDECLQNIFNKAHSKTQQVLAEVQECLRA